MSRTSQQGYVLFTVVVMLFIVAATVYLVSFESSFKSNQPAREMEAARADYVAEAALQHALWQKDNYACTGDFTIPVTGFGTHSYTATISSGATTINNTFNPDHDAWIKEAAPDANFGGESELPVKNKASDSFRALYRFDLSSIVAGSTVQSATAWFYVTANDALGPLEIHAVTADWAEPVVTWNNIATSFDAAVMGSIPPQVINAVWVSVDITALAQQWLNDAAANHGFTLIATSNDFESKTTSREYPTEKPYLDITTSTGAVSPVQIQATGTLDSGVTRTLNRQDVPVYQAPSNLVLNPGSALDDTYTTSVGPTTNHGSDITLEVGDAGSMHYTLMKFDLAAIPVGARIVSADLTLNLESVAAAPTGAVITAHRMLQPWTENGATYIKSDGSTNWAWPGNFDSVSVAATLPFESPSPGWYSWDIRSLVAGWTSLAGENYGLVLASMNGVNNATFTSSDGVAPSLHPRLTVSFACECASACIPPQGSGAILFVVDNKILLKKEEKARKASFESWGYTVSLINDTQAQAAFDAQAALHDMIYVSEHANDIDVGTKLTNLSIGVVNEEGKLNDELGIASGEATAVGSSITILDTSHYISKLFSAGPLKIYAADMEGLTVRGTEAPGLQMLGDWGGVGGLVVLDQGAETIVSGVASGRRVMLPLGRSTGFNHSWKYINNDGRLIVQRSIEWAMGPKAASGATSLLLVVGNGASLTQQEIFKKVMIESWGFFVTVINEDDSQVEFDAAMAVADIVFVTEDVNAINVGTKLTGAVIGVVTEEADLSDEFGFSDSVAWGSATELNIDNNYFVTSSLSAGPVTLLSSSENIAYLTGLIAPEIQLLGSSGGGSALVSLEAGALSTIGAAAGRRVLLPWGGDAMDINNLNADGLTVFRRALEWAGDSGTTATSSYILSTQSAAILGGLSFTRIDLAAYKPWNGTASLFFDGSLTDLDAAIDAVHVLANGHLVLSSNDDTNLGGVDFEDGDLVDYDVVANTSTLIFDGSALFTDPTEKIISVHVLDNHHFVISTDSIATLGGLSFTDRDLVEYDTATNTASLFFDGSLTTLSVDISAVQVLSNGHIVLSPTGNTTLGGVSVAAGDLVDYDPLADTAELIFDGSTLFSDPNENIFSVHFGPGSGRLVCDATFRDEFNATSFSGNNGTLTWAGDWLEVGESDGATLGDILVGTDQGNYQLRTRDNDNGGEGVEREANLFGAVGAMLSYDYRRDRLNSTGDYTSVEVSANGAAGPWTELARHQGSGTDASYLPANHDISDYISANTRIRFKTSPTMGNNESVWFDNIQILCSP